MALVTHLLIVNSHQHVTFRLLGLLILFAVSFSVHNKQVMAADSSNKCTFDAYSSEGQESLNDAKKRLSPLFGKKYTSNDGVEWQYDIGICAQVGNAADAAVIQNKMVNGVATGESHVVGSLKNTHIIVGTDWIMLEYKGGEAYGVHCGKEEKRSVIMFICDPAADDSTTSMVFMKEEKDKTDECYYLFEMKHRAVCTGTSSSLSVGTILIIVFFTVVTVYLLVGFAYARFVNKAKGLEQIPNYQFWKDFGNLQADGCDFLCRSQGRKRSSHFGGIGDDQLETAEDIQDDNLLPM